MFDEVNKYKLNGHFFFQKGDSLKDVSAKVPDEPGVFYIVRLANHRIELVYIGKSGTITQNGSFKDQMLNSRINNKHGNIKRQDFFDKEMEKDGVDALDIYWFVTMDNKNADLPAFVKALLIQRFYEVHGKLPLWNTEF